MNKRRQRAPQRRPGHHHRGLSQLSPARIVINRPRELQRLALLPIDDLPPPNLLLSSLSSNSSPIFFLNGIPPRWRENSAWWASADPDGGTARSFLGTRQPAGALLAEECGHGPHYVDSHLSGILGGGEEVDAIRYL
ncbi:uncharacterized protein A4U43_C01F28700 [Asparagus officinalis]|uniref:Uncharacterized protein n=1 Tax=Asparagus officinalis TaxID=4686 RepID=A0A5P1FWR9_ASPOF|nr:uncharacterized protein A4U43_C01F28700 [Asparagus officinalis]